MLDEAIIIFRRSVKAEAVGLVAGYPCRSLSLQNNNPQSFTDKTSSTGGGFHSTMKYVERNPELQWVLLENVQGMFHVRKKFGDECPMEIQGKAHEKIGVQRSVCAFLLNSSDLRFGTQSAEGVGSLHQGGSSPVFCNYLVSL